MSAWMGGLQVRHTDWEQTPIADHLCTACGHHQRVTGRRKVHAFLHNNPITAHRATCPANQQGARTT